MLGRSTQPGALVWALCSLRVLGALADCSACQGHSTETGNPGHFPGCSDTRGPSQPFNPGHHLLAQAHSFRSKLPPERPILPLESSHSLLYLHFFLWEPGDYVLAHIPEDIKIPNAPLSGCVCEWERQPTVQENQVLTPLRCGIQTQAPTQAFRD